MLPSGCLTVLFTWSQMRGHSFINTNYSEEEVWGLLSRYLEVKHHANPNTIQQGSYTDINKNGCLISVDDQEEEHVTLFCYRNFNFNISGSIIYQFDASLNDEFDLESICKFLNEPFPKILKNEYILNEEQQEERNENIRLLRIKKENENLQNFQKSKARNIAIAMLYLLEYRRGQDQNDRAFHYGQIRRTVADSRFIKQNRILNHAQAVIVSATPPSRDEYLNFINEQKNLITTFSVDFDEVYALANENVYEAIPQIIPVEVRKLGCPVFPLNNAVGQQISAVIIYDAPNDCIMLKNEKYTGGSISLGEQLSEESHALAFLTTQFATADVLSRVLPDACIYTTLTPDNLIHTINDIQSVFQDALLIIAVENEFARITKSASLSTFPESEITQFAQYLADHLQFSKNLAVIFPPTGYEDNTSTFQDVYHEHGEYQLKQMLNTAINELTVRRDNGVLELNHLLETHAEAHEYIRESTGLSLPPLIVLNDEGKSEASISTPVPLINQKTNNTVLFQESRKEFRDWINKAKMPDSDSSDYQMAKLSCRFIKESRSIDLDEIDTLQKSVSPSVISPHIIDEELF